jgi:hypothetical protein
MRLALSYVQEKVEQDENSEEREFPKIRRLPSLHTCPTRFRSGRLRNRCIRERERERERERDACKNHRILLLQIP